MERESLEEGLLISSPVGETKPSICIRDETGTPHGESSVTPVVVLSTLVAVCGSFAIGCSSGYSSPAESGIMEDLDLSVAAYSVFGSLLSAGALIGSLVNGKLADLFGRRGAMWLAELFSIAGWLLIAFSKGAWSLDVGRLLIGFGFGITSYVVPVYIAEITPKNIRGGFTATHQFMICLGFSLMYVLGTVISWRILALIGFVPCLLQVVCLFYIPESPRWLAKFGQGKELETTLQRLREKNADISQEAATIRDFTESFQKDSEVGHFDLFQRRYAFSLIVGVGLMCIQQFGGLNAIRYYASSIFAEADFSINFGTVSTAIILIPAAGASALLIDKFGRRPLLVASTTGMGLSYAIVGLAFWFKDNSHFKEFTPLLVYFGIMGSIVAVQLGLAGLPNIIISEIFPVNIKGSAGSLVTSVQFSCSWLVTYAFNFMLEWSSTGTFFIFSGICAAGTLFVIYLVPETKGRTLEEIQASITHFLKSDITFTPPSSENQV